MSSKQPDSDQTPSEILAARLSRIRIEVFGQPFPPFRPWRNLRGQWSDEPLPGRFAYGSDLVPRHHSLTPLKGRKP